MICRYGSRHDRFADAVVRALVMTVAAALVFASGCGGKVTVEAGSGGAGGAGATTTAAGTPGPSSGASQTNGTGINTGTGTVASAGAGAGSGEGGFGQGGGSANGCDGYCALTEANCVGPNDPWGETVAQQCEATCAHWPAGMPSDTAGNTLGCHTYHAGAAAADPGTHCIHAGPAGDGICGGPCDNFCDLAVQICPGVYASATECKTACMGFPKMPAYSAQTTSGDSYACRLYHLTAAASDPAGHCGHIGQVSPTCQ